MLAIKVMRWFTQDTFESEKFSASFAFVLSLSIHFLFLNFATSNNQVAEPRPIRMEAQINIAELKEQPLAETEEPLQITPQRDIANPEKAIIAKKADIKRIKELTKSGGEGGKDNLTVRKGAALPVLASEESDATGTNDYTVPVVPEENVDIVGDSFGTKPTINSGSIYGSEDGTKIGSIKDSGFGKENGSLVVITDAEYLWNVYGKKIQVYLSKNTVYPERARVRLEQGTVIVRLHQLANGTTKSIDIVQSSGSATLDKHGIQSIQKAIKSVLIPDALIGKNFVIEVPIDFILRPQ